MPSSGPVPTTAVPRMRSGEEPEISSFTPNGWALSELGLEGFTLSFHVVSSLVL